MPWSLEANKQLLKAISTGDITQFRTLLAKYPENLRTSNGYCLWLTEAAETGQFEIVKFLVDEMKVNPGELDSERDEYSVTPADHALSHGHREIAIWLLEHGAEINTEYGGKVDCRILKTAARQGDLELVKWLVEQGADVTANGWALGNALMGCDDKDVCEFLRSVGAADLRETAVADYQSGHSKIIEFIEDHGEVDGNWDDVLDWTIEFSGKPTVSMHCLAPSEDLNFKLLFTVGMSDIPLEFPEEENGLGVELLMCLPPDWPLDPFDQTGQQFRAPMEMLERLARQLLSRGKRNLINWVKFSRDWSIEMNGDPPQPLVSDTDLCGWLTLGKEIWTLDDFRKFEAVEAVPIYAEEADFMLEITDYQPLLQRFERLGIKREFDLNRPNAVTDWPECEPESI